MRKAPAQIELGPAWHPCSNVVKVARCTFYRARPFSRPAQIPGPESPEAALLPSNEVPWEEIAFRTSRVTVERFFEDHRAGRLMSPTSGGYRLSGRATPGPAAAPVPPTRQTPP